MTDSQSAAVPPTSSSSSTQDLRRLFFATPSNQETCTRDACTSTAVEQPQQVPQSTTKPRPAPRATLLTLFPPENLLTTRSRTSLPASSAESVSCQPFKTTYSFSDFKDYASAVHPTAPRVPAPISPAQKPPPPSTVRGPKGVSHPQLKELLQISKAKLANIFPRRSATFTDVTVGSSTDCAIVPSQEESKESSDERERSSPASSSGYHDAYAELVRELARHEEFAAQYCTMPVHETAFLPQGSSPQRGTAAPWLKPINPPRDSEGYTTTDDEFEGVPLRRAYSSRNYPKNNGRFVDDRTRSLSPPPVLIRPITNRVSMESVPSNKQVQLDAARLQQQQMQLVVLSPEQIRYRQENPGQVISMQQSPSPWQRCSPMRASVGSNPSRNRPQIFGVIKEERAEDPPMMRRSFSLNAQQIRHGKSVTLPNLRTHSDGLLDSCPKRVSFSNLPENNSAAGMRDRTSGVAQFPPTPSRRPNSSDSVFLYSPIKYEAPDKPLPPVPEDRISCQVGGRPNNNVIVSTPTTRWHNKDASPPQQQRYPTISPESESGSEAGEIQRILFKQTPAYVSFDDEWTSDGKARGPPGSDPSAPPGSRDEDVRRGGGGSRNRRDEPRRHTLSGEQQAGGGPGAGSAAANLSRSMDLESAALQRSYYHQPAPISSSMFDDDPGIMSEVETASTGFRRGGKQRSSLPVVRTPSKTLERPLGLVFLQYRNETKRALLPNEITSIDTVKALFVRSFPKQLTMEYLDSPMVKIYIHDSSKDMFYELEDLRSHLRDIRDRSVLRLFETPDINGGAGGGVPVGGTPMPGGLPPHPTPAAWDQDQSYFSEPEFDSEYQHQHIHKTKGSSKGGNSPYYMAHSYPPGQPGAGGAATLPRGAPVIRAYSPATKQVSQAGATSPPSKPQRAYQEPSDAADLRSPNPPSHLSPNQPRPQSTPPRPPERWAYLTRSREPIYADRLHTESGYMSSPERGRPPYAAYPAAGAYEDPYYSQYGPRSGSITPVIDEEASDSDELLMDSYSIYSSKVVTGSSATTGRSPQPTPRPSFPTTGNIASQSAAALVPYDATRIRVEHMERQLANLTGLVQKALTQGNSVVVPGPRDFLQIPPNQRDAYRNDDYDKHSSSSSASLPDETYLRAEPSTSTLSTKPPKLGKDKSVSFEKSVSFSDDPPDMLSSPKQHTPQHSADTKPTKPAIKSSTLPRTSSQERDRHKPAPPPKPMSLSSHPGQYDTSRHLYRADLQLTPEMYNHLRVLQKKAKDLRQEVRNLRRMSQAQAHSVRETIRDTFIKIRAMLLTGGGNSWLASGDSEKLRVSREEELYKQEMLRLEKDLTELESTVEELRGNVINKKTRVNMSDVENMALVLSKSSKTVADLKVRFPSLQDGMKSLLSSEMEKVVREEKFLKEEPERLESALRRCKKLTGTLVTLKRLASVQEQRLPIVASNNIQDQQNQRLSPDNLLQDTSLSQSSGAVSPQNKAQLEMEFKLQGSRNSRSSGDGCSPASSSSISARGLLAPAGASGGETSKRQENALDTLLDELQTFARPPSDRHGSIDASTPNPQNQASGTLRRLHSYPSSDSSSPVRSSPISRLQVLEDSKPPSLPERSKVPPPPPPRTSSRSPLVSPTSPPRLAPRGSTGGTLLLRRKREPQGEQDGNSGKPLSSNSSSSESINSQEGLRGSEALEQRHQELLRRQRQLQEQYARLQQLQRNVRLPQAPELKKTGSESNLLRGLNLSAAPTSGSLTHLAPTSIVPIVMPSSQQHTLAHSSGSSKIYETDIL